MVDRLDHLSILSLVKGNGSVGPVVWRDAQGATWMLTGNALDLSALFAQLLADVHKHLWKRAAQHYCGEGLAQGVDFRSAQLMVASFRRAGKAALSAIGAPVAGAVPRRGPMSRSSS